MGKLDGKVAFITGAARGQGRAHAVRLAEEGADIIGIDICQQIPTVPYPLATKEDLDETVARVEALGRRMAGFVADVRDFAAVKDAFDAGTAQVGPVDIVIANAGICVLSVNPVEEEWQDVIDVNLTGVYNTVRVAVPGLIERDRGGAIVIVSSTAGLAGVGGNTPGGLGYTAAKTALVGLMRAYANYLAPHSIRVNTVHPTGTRTDMVLNPAVAEFISHDPAMGQANVNALPVQLIEPRDMANAVAWMVSDDARYVTGVALPVDAGSVNKR